VQARRGDVSLLRGRCCCCGKRRVVAAFAVQHPCREVRVLACSYGREPVRTYGLVEETRVLKAFSCSTIATKLEVGAAGHG
jgi:hypothetical protein